MIFDKFTNGYIFTLGAELELRILNAEDGKRYEFDNKNWISKTNNPNAGIEIEDEKALNIYVLNQDGINRESINKKEIATTAILSLIFGVFGLTSTWWFFAIIKRNSTTLTGRGLALIGLVIGYVVIINYLLLTTIFIGLVS